MHLERLFGSAFPLELVAEWRVRRVETKGIAANVLLGSQPIWLVLTLRDGRKLEAHARGPGPEHESIRAVIAELAQRKLREVLEGLAHGASFTLGAVELRPEGVRFGGRLLRWEAVAGYAVRDGGLLWDDERGKLAGEVWLNDAPFCDALVGVFEAKLPGKDYDRMQPGQGPRHGYFSITARTRVPGTFKYQLHVFILGPLLVALAFGLYVGGRRAWMLFGPEPPRMPKPYVAALPAAKEFLEERAPKGEACSFGSGEVELLAADGGSASRYEGHEWKPMEVDEVGYASTFHVWTVAHGEVRVAEWDASAGAARCYAAAPSEGAPEALARKLAHGWEAPAASAKASASAPPSGSVPGPTRSAPKPRR